MYTFRREYKEALKQQRSQEVYKLKEQKQTYDPRETPSPQPSDEMEIRLNGNAQGAKIPKSIMKNCPNIINATLNDSSVNINGCCVENSTEETTVTPKKPIQKVIPSRNNELMSTTKHIVNDVVPSGTINGDCIGYIKPNSPMKILNGGTGLGWGNGLMGVGVGILPNSNKFATTTIAVATSLPGSIKPPVGSNGNKAIAGKAHR